ncbi:hypothetical protein GYB22_06495 [bacterium]|nr:hypothetical protein [bacterium]
MKILTSLVLLLFPILSQAQLKLDSNQHLQVGFGVFSLAGNLVNTELQKATTSASFFNSAFVTYGVGEFRARLMFEANTVHKKEVESMESGGVAITDMYNTKLINRQFSLGIFQEIGESRLKPYLGIELFYTRFKNSFNLSYTIDDIYVDRYTIVNKGHKLGIGPLVGLSYQFANNIKCGIEFNANISKSIFTQNFYKTTGLSNKNDGQDFEFHVRPLRMCYLSYTF